MSGEFVDTNVLLYAYDPSAGERHALALELVSRLGRERQGTLSIQVLQEFYVNAVQKIAVRLEPADALARLRVLSRWRTHSPLPHDVFAAIELAQRYQLSFWDSMIVRSAQQLECDVLWSEDLSSGQQFDGVTVRSPFAS